MVSNLPRHVPGRKTCLRDRFFVLQSGKAWHRFFKRLACYLYSKPAKFVGCEPTFSDMAAAPAESDLEIVGFSG